MRVRRVARSVESGGAPPRRALAARAFAASLRRGATSLLLAATTLLAAACGGDGVPRRVVIPSGASFRVAADSLARRGVIRFPRAFRAYASWTRRDRAIKAGTYEFRSEQGWGELLDALAAGRGLVHTFTIPEGYDLAAIAKVIARSLDVPVDSVRAAARDTALLHRLDVPTPTLEGYLFPDTYTFPPGATARDAVDAMVHRFETIWKPAWDSAARAMALSRNDIMSLAAIIEKEARLPEERPVISAVYHNRLSIGMRLQADPTVQYALGRHVERVLFKDLEIDSQVQHVQVSRPAAGPDRLARRGEHRGRGPSGERAVPLLRGASRRAPRVPHHVPRALGSDPPGARRCARGEGRRAPGALTTGSALVVRRWGENKRGPHGDIHATREGVPATAYSPAISRSEYHRRCRA